MAERLGGLVRRRRMRMRVLVLLVVAPLLVAGCGDDLPVADDGHGQFASPSPSSCRGGVAPVPLVRADLDGDDRPDDVDFVPPSGTCRGSLSSSVRNLEAAPAIAWDASAATDGATAVELPGRTGDLVLLLEQHPRGGFQAHLYGYADGRLAELTVGGGPVFPFVATDALTDPLAARCTGDGFEILHGRRHEPIGVVPAWDVERTTYRVEDNTVAKGATTEIADNVLEKDFHDAYRALADYSLFENCRAGS